MPVELRAAIGRGPGGDGRLENRGVGPKALPAGVEVALRGRPPGRPLAFRYAFGNAVDEVEAKDLYATFAVPASGAPLFQAATANLNPWAEVKVDTKNPKRGPLLIISGEVDHTDPRAIARASYKKQKRKPGETEFVELANRGHALTIDGGWREVADIALAFIQRFV